MTLTLANTITADMGLIPGLALAGPAAGLPLSVLAGFVERPFVSAAGGFASRRAALAVSLWANFLSLLVGYLLLFAVAALTDAAGSYGSFGAIVPFAAIACSTVIERWVVLGRTGGGTRTARSWAWMAAANVLSAAACVGVLLLVIYFRKEMPAWRYHLRPLTGPLTLVALVGSLAAFAWAYASLPPREVVPPPVQ